MNRTARLVHSLILLSVLVVGCSRVTPESLADGSDPLAALRSPTRSARYDGSFWNREAEQQTDLWQGAVEYCRTPGNSSAPNCQIVGLVLSTIELERAAKEAKLQLQQLVEQGQAFAAPREAPLAGDGQ